MVDISPMVRNLKGQAILVCAMYLRPGIGITGENKTRSWGLAAFVSAVQLPWAAHAVWNCAPDEI
eukprot:7708817-Lingulodinium_polyedra.AAC.1